MKTTSREQILLRWRLYWLIMTGIATIGIVFYALVWLPGQSHCRDRPVRIVEKEKDGLIYQCEYQMASFTVTVPNTWQGVVGHNQVGETTLCEQRVSFAPPWGSVVFRAYYDGRADALERWARSFYPSSQQMTTIHGYRAIKQVADKSEMYFIRYGTYVLVISVDFASWSSDAAKDLDQVLSTLRLFPEHE